MSSHNEHIVAPLHFDGDDDDFVFLTLVFFGVIAVLLLSFAYCVYRSTITPCVKKPKAI